MIQLNNYYNVTLTQIKIMKHCLNIGKKSNIKSAILKSYLNVCCKSISKAMCFFAYIVEHILHIFYTVT